MFVDSKQFLYSVLPCLTNPLEHLIREIGALPAKTCFNSMFLKRLMSEQYIRSLLVPTIGIEHLTQLHRIAYNSSESFDISSLKIWCAMIYLMKREYNKALRIAKDAVLIFRHLLCSNHPNVALKILILKCCMSRNS